jgi:hypothetical protein
MVVLEPASKPLDRAGNIFINYDPGRYNGVIVLRPDAEGFIDFDSLPTVDNYAGMFYWAEAQDVDDDGVLEIVHTTNDCNPSCVEGKLGENIYQWNGTEFIIN